ncbi:tetratricopeptide repeat protein 41-like [Pelodytes ibericus]
MSQTLKDTIEQQDHHYYFTHRPPIHPYVCSTANDFLDERNYLAQHVFPKLNDFSFSRGTYFKPVDLRWTEKSTSNIKSGFHEQAFPICSQQLKICLDYIGSSSPFFLCILGHTYGEFLTDTQCHLPAGSPDLPDLSALSRVEQNLIVAANNGYPWVLEEGNKQCSLTELEITQAILSRDAQFQYFYFRDHAYVEEKLQNTQEDEKKTVLSTFASENELEESKIWELKIKIVDRGLPVRFFKTKEQLGHLVLKDWCDVIEKMYPLSSIPANIGHEHSLAQAYNEAFSESLCKDFVSSKQLEEKLTALDTFALGALRNKQSRYSLRSHSSGTGSLVTTSSIMILHFFFLFACRLKSSPELRSILLLHGVRGCGKSTLVAEWLRLFRKCKPALKVIPYFVGSNGRSNDIMCFMRHCIMILQGEYFGVQGEDLWCSENITDMWKFPLLVEVFLASIALKPCVLLLDGVNELSGIHRLPSVQAKGFTWLPVNLPEQCKIIMTTTSSHLSYKFMVERADVELIELESLPMDTRRLSIFHRHLAMPDKQITPEQVECIVKKKAKITPLKLAVLASELRLCGSCKSESSSIDDYLEALSTEQLWSFLIQYWVKDFSWTCESLKKGKKSKQPGVLTVLPEMNGWVVDVLCLLSISRCGLGDDDILQLLKIMGYQDNLEVTSLHWAAFRLATSKWIQEKPDGLLHFRHPSCRDAVDHLLLGVAVPISESLDNTFQTTMNNKRRRFHQLLIKYFIQIGLSRRVYEEVPWHVKMIGNLNELCRFLSNIRILDLVSRSTMFGYQMKMDLIHYWQILFASGKDPAAEYEKMTVNNAESMDKAMCELTDSCRIMCFVAQCLKDIGKTDEAEKILSFVESQLEKNSVDKKNVNILLWTQTAIGDLYGETGSWRKAAIYYQKALHTYQGFTPVDIEDNIQLKKLQGRLKCKLAVANAIQFNIVQHNQTLEEAKRHFQSLAPGPYEQAALQLCQGICKFTDGNFSESENHLWESYNIQYKLYGKNHILTGEVQEYLADLKSHPKNNTYSHRLQALEIYKEVIHIKEAAEELSPSVGIKQNLKLSLSNTLFKAGNLLCQADFSAHKEAIGMLQRSLDLRTSILGLDHPLSCEVLSFLKDVKRRVCSNKGHLGLITLPSFMEHKHIQDNRGSKNFHPPARRQTYEFLRSAPDLGGENDGDTSELQWQCDSKEQRLILNILEKRKCQSSQGEKVLCIQEHHTSSEEDRGLQTTRAITARKTASMTNRGTSAHLSRPVSVCHTSMTGSLSSIVALTPFTIPLTRSKSPKLIHKSAWYHVPGRYPTLQTPFPPKRHQFRD